MYLITEKPSIYQDNPLEVINFNGTQTALLEKAH